MALIPEDTVTVDGILKNSPGHRTSPKNSLSVHLTLQEMMGAVGRERANQVKSIYIYIYTSHFLNLFTLYLETKNLNLAFCTWLPPHRTAGAGVHQALLFPWLNHCGQNLTTKQKD